MMPERITIYRLRELSDLIAQECDVPILIDTQNKKSTITFAGYRDGQPASEIAHAGSIREAYAFLLGMALVSGIDAGAL